MKRLLTVLSSISIFSLTTFNLVACSAIEFKTHYSGDYLKNLFDIDDEKLKTIAKTSKLIELINEKISNFSIKLTEESVKEEWGKIIVLNEAKAEILEGEYDAFNKRRYVKIDYKVILKREGKDYIIESENATFALINK